MGEKIVAKLGVGGIVGAALFVVSSAFSIYQQRRQRKALRRLQQQQNVITGARPTPNGFPIHRPYGLTFFEASPPVYLGTGTRFPSRGTTGYGSLATGAKGRDSLLLAQYVLTTGAVSIRDIYLDGVRLNDSDRPELAQESWIEYTYSPDTFAGASYVGNATATAFCADSANSEIAGQRDNSSHFYPLSYLTCVFHLNLDAPAFRGIPSIAAVVDRGAPDLEGAGSSNNLVSVIAEELRVISADRGSTTLSIDQDSFAAAWRVANRVVQGTGSVLLSEPLPAELARNLGAADDNYETLFRSLGFRDNADSGVRRNSVVQLKRYEFNGIIDATQTRVDALETLIAHAPGAELFRSVNGLWKLALPDSMTLEPEQIVGTISDDELINPVRISWPDTSRRFNRVRANFANVNKDFAEDEIAFPRQGSPLEAVLLAADNDADLSTTLYLEGCHNIYSATSIAANTLLLSRREIYQFEVTPIGFIYEPGDVLRLIDSAQNIDVFVRVNSTRVLPTLNVEVTALRFNRHDYAWYPDTPDTLNLLAPTFRRPRPPASIDAAFNAESGLVTVRWQPHAQESIWTRGYELQHRLRDESEWQPLAVTNERGGGTFKQYPGALSGAHVWRVRSTGYDGEVSEWVESAVLDIEPETQAGLGVEYIYTVDDDGVIPANEEPLNSWGYREFGAVNGRQWLPTGGLLTQELPLLVRYSREIEGSPDTGDPVDALWRYDGIAGGLGRDGTDGRGREWIFAITATDEFPSGGSPDNAWAFDAPGNAGGLQWHDAAPALTEELPVLWSSYRLLDGDDTVAGDWSAPAIVGRYGLDGEDGSGYEFLYARWAADSLPANSGPRNHWAFEQTGTINGVVWRDDPPGLTQQFRYLFFSRRRVRGSEPRGNWSPPSLHSQLGADGTSAGFEFAFRATANETPIPARPSDDSDYGAPGGGWAATQPYLTEELPWLWSSSRTYTESTDGTTSAGFWTQPVIVGHRGIDGDTQTVETIWAATSEQSVSAPDDSWAADSPQSPWFDTPPNLSEDFPYLWVSNRLVGDGETWSAPTLAGHYGIDGRAGDDGAGIEQIFWTGGANSEGAPNSPPAVNDGWAYDAPGNGWSDAATPVSEQTPYLWSSTRLLSGTMPTSSWSAPAIIGAFGPRGEKGEKGDPGETVTVPAPSDPDDGGDGGDDTDDETTTPPVLPPTKGGSTINTLSSLTVSRGTLSPSFSPTRQTYTVTVEADDPTINVSATPTDSAASIVSGTGTHSLTAGTTTTIRVVVRAENTSQRIYQISVFRPGTAEPPPPEPPPDTRSDDATLSSLTVLGRTLAPTFAPLTFSYSLAVEHDTETVTVGATPTDSNATVTGTGTFTLNVGANSRTIDVTAENETTRLQYVINIFRPSPPGGGDTENPFDGDGPGKGG